MKMIKRWIKLFLAMFNVGIYKIHNQKNLVHITNALQHNSPEGVDKYFDNDDLVKSYITKQRICYYHEILKINRRKKCC